MSSTVVNSLVPPVAPLARAATASMLRDRLIGLGRAIWRALGASSQARARRELLRLAALYAHQPEMARQLRAAASWDGSGRSASDGQR